MGLAPPGAALPRNNHVTGTNGRDQAVFPRVKTSEENTTKKCIRRGLCARFSTRRRLRSREVQRRVPRPTPGERARTTIAILLDIKMPEMDGIAFLEASKGSYGPRGAHDRLSQPPMCLGHAGPLTVVCLRNSRRPCIVCCMEPQQPLLARCLGSGRGLMVRSACVPLVRPEAKTGTHHAAAARSWSFRACRSRSPAPPSVSCPRAIRRGRVGKRGPDGRSLAVVDLPCGRGWIAGINPHAPWKKRPPTASVPCS